MPNQKIVVINMALAASLLLAVPSYAEQYTGMGSAPITKDVDTVRTQAEMAAKRDLVKNLLRREIGEDRLGEVPDATIDNLASRIQSSMIVGQDASKNGKLYQLTITAEIDAAWFGKLLDDARIKSSSDLAGGASQMIFVMLDESAAIAKDSSKPTSVQIEFDRNIGSSYSDESVSAYSEKEKAAASFSDKSAASSRSSGAAGYSNGYGSGAVSGRSSSSAANSSRGASASSRSVSSVDKTDVFAEQHDNTRYRETVVYQAGVTKNGPAGAALSGLSGQFIQYGLSMADPTVALNERFRGNIPTYEALKTNGDFVGFTRFIATKNAPFFMGGAIAITDGGKDITTGNFQCSGKLNVSVYSTSDGALIGATEQSVNGYARIFEDCETQVSQKLAKLVADDVGPQIRSFWRKRVSNLNETIAAATQGGQFTLVIKANEIDLGMQADVYDALGAISGVTNPALIAQGSTQMSFVLTYQGGTPLQIALFQKLRSNSTFAQMKPTVEGRTITLCISAC